MNINFDKLSGISKKTILDPKKDHQIILETMDIAKDGCNKIKKARKTEFTLQEIHENTINKIDQGADLYEPFDSLVFEGKLRIDLAYYDQLLQKLEEHQSDIENELSSLYGTVRELYEFVNIKPEVYGRKITIDFLNESVDDQQRELTKIIYEYIDTKFYRLTPQKRKERYLEEAKIVAKQLIQEGEDPDKSIQHAIKTIVMEGLLSRIAIPQHINYRIKYLIEDPNYGAIFDQDNLIQLYEVYTTKINKMAQVISVIL